MDTKFIGVIEYSVSKHYLMDYFLITRRKQSLQEWFGNTTITKWSMLVSLISAQTDIIYYLYWCTHLLRHTDFLFSICPNRSTALSNQSTTSTYSVGLFLILFRICGAMSSRFWPLELTWANVDCYLFCFPQSFMYACAAIPIIIWISISLFLRFP